MAKQPTEKTKPKPKYPTPPKAYARFLSTRPRLASVRVPGRRPTIEDLCELVEQLANEEVAKSCAAKEFGLDSIYMPCDGPVQGDVQPVDLVILIDTSGSMSDEATALSQASEAAINSAQQHCRSDLRTAWFGLEGTFPGTQFTTTLRDYLHGLGIADADIKHRSGGVGQEDGARGIEDVVLHFDWRPNASRALLFLGDEPLEGGSPQGPDDKVAADNAIATANASGNNVTVFTYAGTDIQFHVDPVTGVTAVDEYARVATSTGGIAFGASGGGIEEFEQVLEETICTTVGTGCAPVRIPEIRPCFNLRWGDGPQDHIETDDVEVLCLVASNRYSNVTLKDVEAYVLVLGPDGLPAPLPDGTPSVQIKPSYVICFGDLAPCGTDDPARPSSVSREIVLMSRGAKAGPYFVLVAYCYRAEFHLAFGSIFQLELVAS